MHDYGFLVNQVQSSQQRRFKYKLLKNFDLTHHERRRLRDWNWSKILGNLTNRDLENAEAISEWLNNCYDIFREEINMAERDYRMWCNA